MSETKCCKRCNKELPLTEFSLKGYSDKGKPRRRAMCNTCRNEVRRIRKVRGAASKEEVELPVTAPHSDVYVITYAQNATPINSQFFQSLLQYCDHNNAKLLVIPGRYKNPTSVWSETARDYDWWDHRLNKYLFAGRLDISDALTVYGDISIQPTAVTPLTGFEPYAGKNSAIFGHPKLQLQTVPTAKRRYPRIFTTTGAVTQPNYTKSKAGKKGEIHHVFGATIVEKTGDHFFLRQINAEDSGSFIDLDKKYTPRGVEKAKPMLALVCGDIHAAHPDADVLDATFYAKDSIVNTLDPQEIYFHDLFDMEARNHHNRKNFMDRYRRMHDENELDSVEAEVELTFDFINSCAPGRKKRVVASNHDLALDRWLLEADFRQDPKNAKFFISTWNTVLERTERTGEYLGSGFGALQALYEERHPWTKGTMVEFLSRDEPIQVKDIFLNFHGDIGTSGSRGSINTFAKLGVKVIIGHSHAPGIRDGAFQVGVTGALDQGYNHLPSSWLHAHAGVYANGKRVLLFVIDGRWRGE